MRACSSLTVTILASALAAMAPASAAAEAQDRASASQRASVVFGGTSGRDPAPFVLRLAADRRALTGAALWVDLRCDDGSTAIYAGAIDFAQVRPPGIPDEGATPVLAPRRVPANGRFATSGVAVATYGASPGVLDFELSGSARGASARGTLTVRLRIVDVATCTVASTCRSGAVQWRASSAPGRIFGGSTAEGRPVVIELARNRRSVRRAYIGWSVGCRPEGRSVSRVEVLADFRLDRRRAFGDTFAQSVALDAGGRRTAAYEFRGRVGRSRVSGTFDVGWVETDASGVTVLACRTGRIRWSADSTPGA